MITLLFPAFRSPTCLSCPALPCHALPARDPIRTSDFLEHSWTRPGWRRRLSGGMSCWVVEALPVLLSGCPPLPFARRRRMDRDGGRGLAIRRTQRERKSDKFVRFARFTFPLGFLLLAPCVSTPSFYLKPCRTCLLLLLLLLLRLLLPLLFHAALELHSAAPRKENKSILACVASSHLLLKDLIRSTYSPLSHFPVHPNPARVSR